MVTKTASNIRVAARFRPINKIESEQCGGKTCVKISGCNRACLVENKTSKRPYPFTLDQVYDSTASQKDVYSYFGKPLIDDALSGVNSTIFAYGQTGSGKTWTMMGIPRSEDQAGMIPRIGKDLFAHIEGYKGPDRFEVSVKMVEIYLEKVYDLFDPSAKYVQIGTAGGSVTVKSSAVRVHTFDEYVDQVEQGIMNRATSATAMNKESSRSHCIIIIEFAQIKKSGGRVTSKIKMVDLAGSEKTSKTQCVGQRLSEANAINLSLTSLSTCMKALSEGRSYVPYRNSKLTLVLQDSLGGSCKCSLICATSPCIWNADETISTLRFAIRAKKVKNVAFVNEDLTPAEYQARIAALEKQLEVLKFQAGWDAKKIAALSEWVRAHGGGDPAALLAAVAPPAAEAQREQAFDFSGASWGEVSSHSVVIDKVTGKTLFGQAVHKAHKPNESADDDAKNDGVVEFAIEQEDPAVADGITTISAQKLEELQYLRDELEDSVNIMEGKDSLIAHLEASLEECEHELVRVAKIATTHETQASQSEFFRRKAIYMEQDLMGQLAELQLENQHMAQLAAEMADENLDEVIAATDGKAAAVQDADVKRTLAMMRRKLKKAQEKNRRLTKVAHMGDKHLAKFDKLDVAGQRALFQKCVANISAVRGKIGEAKRAQDRFKERSKRFVQKEALNKKLRANWQNQVKDVSRAIALSQQLYQRDTTKLSLELEQAQARSKTLESQIQKLREMRKSSPTFSTPAAAKPRAPRANSRRPVRNRPSSGRASIASSVASSDVSSAAAATPVRTTASGRSTRARRAIRPNRKMLRAKMQAQQAVAPAPALRTLVRRRSADCA